MPSDPTLRFNILVVDEDPYATSVLLDNLKLDGYAATAAVCGREALALFKSDMFSLVILDLRLPDMNGIQVCRSIRAVSHVPIIMLTAKNGVSDKVLGLESGADDYLVKPCDYLELAARIKARLRRSHSYHCLDTLETPSGCGRLCLNLDKRQVSLDDRPVALTCKEFDILALLFEHMGKTVSREMIRRSVWPNTSLYQWSRAIDVHVQHLRSKLERNPARPRCIVTVQGLGYKLQPE